jgi:hypothetical protein
MCLETDRFALWIYEEIANRPDILAEERWLSSVDGLYAAYSVACKTRSIWTDESFVDAMSSAIWLRDCDLGISIIFISTLCPCSRASKP